MGRVFDSATSFANLLSAQRRAARGHRDSADVLRFQWDLEPELLALQAELRSGLYRPRPYRQFRICDPKPRTITVADFRDRVVHHALCAPLEIALERTLIHDTYACRKGKGTRAALLRAARFTRRYRYALSLDVERYFDSIDHECLIRALQRTTRDRPYLETLERIIRHPIPGQWLGRGLPIGNLTSQHFANLYLSPLDHRVRDRLAIGGYLRYMDDMLLFSDDPEALRGAARCIGEFLSTHWRLRLKASATRLVPVTEGVAFLGWRLFPGTTRLSGAAKRRLRRRLARRTAEARQGRISEAAYQRSVESLCAYAAQGDTLQLRRALTVAAPEGTSGARRVKRGGSWNNNAQNCRSANRNNNDPDNRYHSLGLRPASSAP